SRGFPCCCRVTFGPPLSHGNTQWTEVLLSLGCPCSLHAHPVSSRGPLLSTAASRVTSLAICAAPVCSVACSPASTASLQSCDRTTRFCAPHSPGAVPTRSLTDGPRAPGTDSKASALDDRRSRSRRPGTHGMLSSTPYASPVRNRSDRVFIVA